MANGVQELIETLQTLITDAWGLPLGPDKCVIEREKALDILEDMKAQLPVEINEAKKLVENRAQIIANAKREAEMIKKDAQEEARRMVSQQEILQKTNQVCAEKLRQDKAKADEIMRAANDYAEDAMKRTEEAIAAALKEVHQSRVEFRTTAYGSGQNNLPLNDEEI